MKIALMLALAIPLVANAHPAKKFKSSQSRLGVVEIHHKVEFKKGKYHYEYVFKASNKYNKKTLRVRCDAIDAIIFGEMANLKSMYELKNGEAIRFKIVTKSPPVKMLCKMEVWTTEWQDLRKWTGKISQGKIRLPKKKFSFTLTNKDYFSIPLPASLVASYKLNKN